MKPDNLGPASARVDHLEALLDDARDALHGMLAAYFEALPAPARYDSTADNDPRVIAARAVLARSFYSEAS